MARLSSDIALVLLNFDQAFDKKAWHGTNLRGSLRGLTLDEVSFRPQPERHNIWEIALHCAYWKYAVRRRLTGEKRGSFPYPGSNFFLRPEPGGGPSAADWKRDLRLLEASHRALRVEIERLTAKRLRSIPTGSKVTNLDILLGIAAHDLYHAGQIQLLKRLARAGI